MKRYFKASIMCVSIMCVFSALTLVGCGGGSGGASPVTKAVTKVYLYGNMSSNSKIATVKTTLNIPSGVMLNYSAAPGATSGSCILRKGVIVPSGPLKVAASDLDGSRYDISNRQLSIYMVNSGFLNLSSSTIGNGGKGREIATINFALASPGVTPSSMPLVDSLPTVGQDRQNAPNYLSGCTINFATTYQ